MAVDFAEQFVAWVSQTQAAEQKRVEEMKTFSDHVEKLSKSYRDASKDLDRERLLARITQENMEGLKRRVEEFEKSIERSSFVLVLIDADADGYIFKDEYYADLDGGRKAALDLRNSVQEYLRKSHPELSSLPITIKAFANADGLSQLLVKAKLIKSHASLTGFAKGFSQALETSDFVLVGSGKDRADEKIKGVFQQFIENPTCRHVIFGACHDNGYVRVLEKYQESTVADQVTLLCPFETGKEFTGLEGFRSTRMTSIFRNEPVTIPSRQYSPPLAAPQTQGVAVAQAPGSSMRGTGTESPWRIVAGSTGPALPHPTVSRRPENLPPGTVYVNAADQRVDSALPPTPPDAQRTWNHKIKAAKMRYCRKYHLQANSCTKNDGDCEYSHGPLTEGELLAYRQAVRLERCHVGAQCRDATCFYGHHCFCSGKQSCKFPPGLHRVDVSSVRVLSCA